MAYTKTTLANLKADLLKLVGGHGTFWSDYELELAINEALNVWQLLVGEFSARAVIDTYGNEEVFQLVFNPTNGTFQDWLTDTTSTWTDTPLPLSVWRVGTIATYTTSGFAERPWLTQFDVKHEDYGNPGWTTATTTQAESWAPWGINMLVFNPHTPVPLSADYYVGDRILRRDDDYVQLGDEERQAILAYGVWQLNVKNGVTEAFLTSEPLKQLFLIAANTRNAKLRGSRLYKRWMGMDTGDAAPLRDAQPAKGAR